MFIKLRSLFVCALFSVFSVFGFEPHVWTDHDGRTAEASFVALEGRTLVLVKGSRTMRVPLDTFVEADQEYALQCATEAKRINSTFHPCEIYDGLKFSGKKSFIESGTVYSGPDIPDSLAGEISSLILKKGYQVCIAIRADGTGLSKVLIANKRDIRIPKLSKEFDDNIQYIRVTPFRNVAKRGHCGIPKDEFNAAWFYRWGGTDRSTEQLLWTPMIFGKQSAGQWTTDLVKHEGIQEIIGFNEPDGGDAKILIPPEQCASLMKNAMKVGLRIGSPSYTENGPKEVLAAFMKAAEAEQLRIDFLCVHWYDWGGLYKERRLEEDGRGRSAIDEIRDPENIFERFKNYMTDVHKQWELPIWITEWNANLNRDNATQQAFVKMALEWMDETPWIERYSYFQPVPVLDNLKLSAAEIANVSKDWKNKRRNYPGAGDFCVKRSKNPAEPLTELGRYWAGFQSAPSMSEDVYLGKNNICEDEVE